MDVAKFADWLVGKYVVEAGSRGSSERPSLVMQIVELRDGLEPCFILSYDGSYMFILGETYLYENYYYFSTLADAEAYLAKGDA